MESDAGELRQSHRPRPRELRPSETRANGPRRQGAAESSAFSLAVDRKGGRLHQLLKFCPSVTGFAQVQDEVSSLQ